MKLWEHNVLGETLNITLTNTFINRLTILQN